MSFVQGPRNRGAGPPRIGDLFSKNLKNRKISFFYHSAPQVKIVPQPLLIVSGPKVLVHTIDPNAWFGCGMSAMVSAILEFPPCVPSSMNKWLE